MSKKKKYSRVSLAGGHKEILPGNEIALLQQSGAYCKILRRATKEEYNNQFKI